MDKFTFNLRVKEIERATTKKDLNALVRSMFDIGVENTYYHYLSSIDYEQFNKLSYIYRLLSQLALKHSTNRWLQRERQYFTQLRSALSEVYSFSQYKRQATQHAESLCTYKNFTETFEYDTQFTISNIDPVNFKKFAVLIGNNIPKQQLNLSINADKEASNIAEDYYLMQMLEAETIKRSLDADIRWTVIENIRDTYFSNTNDAEVKATQERIDVLQTSLNTIKTGKPWIISSTESS